MKTFIAALLAASTLAWEAENRYGGYGGVRGYGDRSYGPSYGNRGGYGGYNRGGYGGHGAYGDKGEINRNLEFNSVDFGKQDLSLDKRQGDLGRDQGQRGFQIGNDGSIDKRQGDLGRIGGRGDLGGLSDIGGSDKNLNAYGRREGHGYGYQQDAGELNGDHGFNAVNHGLRDLSLDNRKDDLFRDHSRHGSIANRQGDLGRIGGYGDRKGYGDVGGYGRRGPSYGNRGGYGERRGYGGYGGYDNGYDSYSGYGGLGGINAGLASRGYGGFSKGGAYDFNLGNNYNLSLGSFGLGGGLGNGYGNGPSFGNSPSFGGVGGLSLDNYGLGSSYNFSLENNPIW